MTIARAQMYRQLYQNGGNTLPIYPRIEAIETSLGGAEERIGDPALGQSSNSPLSNVYNNEISKTGIGSIFGNTGDQQPDMQQPLPSPIIDSRQPGMYQPGGPPRDPNMFSTTPPRPMQPSSQIDPNSPRSLPFASAVGPSMQGVGDPRLGAATIPGNKLQMQMRGPQQAPMQQFSYGGRAGYQEGGIGMMQDQTIYNPLQSNYYSGMPTMMASGGRIGYEEGGMGMMQPQQPQQMMEPPLQGMEQPQADIKDPKQALEIIIQMLIAQGIPPEQAKEIAIQMVQAVAEGGMQEMSDERVEARFGGRIGYASGGIGSLVNREGYFLGSVFKGIGKAVKGVTKAVKSIVKSDLGKAALAAAAIYATGGGALFGGPGFGSAGTLFGPGGTLGGASGIFGSPAGGFGLEAISTPGLLGTGGQFAPMSGTLFGSNSALSGLTSGLFGGGGGGGNILSSLGGNALTSLAAGALGGALAGGIPQQQPGESDADYQNRVNEYKTQFQTAINNPKPQFGQGQFPNNPFYPQRAANGGRIGYQEGGIGDLIQQVTKQEFFGTPMMANGGRMGYAMGAEVPVRKNEAGVKELDYRDTGGFVPPIGIKERADDIPAMLSNNEFVFTADAVRNAGGGDENIGAQRMYKLMKNLEAGGIV